MKSPRSRTTRKRSSSIISDNSNISGCNFSSSSSSNRRRSKRNLTIDLEAAKRIVKNACMSAAGFDPNGVGGDTTPTEDGGDGEDNRGFDEDNDSESEFSKFVSSAIAQVAVSSEAVANNNNNNNSSSSSSTQKQQQNRPGRPRKRPRQLPLESKVRGLEHAESLHTMCSLFPVVMGTVDDEPMMATMATTASNTESKDQPSDDGELEVESSNSNADYSSSDHDSLLPPVGDATSNTDDLGMSTTPSPTNRTTTSYADDKKPVEVSTGPIFATRPSPRRQRERQSPPLPATRTTKPARPRPPTVETTTTRTNNNNNNNDTASTLLALAHSPPGNRFGSSSNRATSQSDDDCNYDRPLIGVTGFDEPTETGSPYCTNNGEGNEGFIRFTRVGSVVTHAPPSLEASRRCGV